MSDDRRWAAPVRPHHSLGSDPAPLRVLAIRLREARDAVAQHRHGPVGSEAAVGSRRMMLQALEDYIGALETLRLPVPYALRDELRLHQQLFDR